MNTFKITFNNGDSLVTGFNGTVEDAKKYYLKNIFNLGDATKDVMVKGIKVEVIL